MNRRAIVFEAGRTGYSIDQATDGRYVMTIGDLKELLEDFYDDDLFILSHDNGYTYGSISDGREAIEDEDGEWEFM